jgi:hypothetical protein
MKHLYRVSLVLLFCNVFAFGQKELTIKGNVETTFQYLNPDSLIGAVQPDSKALLNAYGNVYATFYGFRAGVRLESYLPRIQGYPDRFDGTGIGMRYVAWGNKFVDVTLGSIYEQFGSGILLRAYEDRALGYDNMIDGVRLKLTPYRGITIKGVYGNQRLNFQSGKIIKSAGITRGVDVEFSLGDIFKKIEEKELSITIAGTFVSKFQKDDNDELILPQNVGSYGARIGMLYKGFSANFDYARKENDPSVDNNYIYNTGQAALANIGYSRKGLGILLSAKSVDNMSYRSDRTKTLQDVFINYLPALNRTHTYNLVATLYPYATQPMGEVAFQGEVLYTIPKGSKIGGKYGTTVDVNFSTAYAPVHHTNGYGTDSSRVMYKSNLFDKSNQKYWQDFNIKLSRKFNKHFEMSLAYFNIQLNNDISKVTNNATGIINANIGVAEFEYKINSKHAIRAEVQALFTKKDHGNWATLVLEYTISPNWFFSIIDQYNYGNPEKDKRLHHIVGAFGYTHESSRIMVSYGRQRAGIFCVGGVCRYVPASNGLTIMFTQSF